MLGTQDFPKLWGFQILRYPKFIFAKDVPILFLYFLAILVIVGRSTGPDFDQIFEVPEIIQKVLEHDGGP